VRTCGNVFLQSDELTRFENDASFHIVTNTDLKDDSDEKNNGLIPFGNPLFSDGGAITK
jgi:hypothetical protein